MGNSNKKDAAPQPEHQYAFPVVAFPPEGLCGIPRHFTPVIPAFILELEEEPGLISLVNRDEKYAFVTEDKDGWGWNRAEWKPASHKGFDQAWGMASVANVQQAALYIFLLTGRSFYEPFLDVQLRAMQALFGLLNPPPKSSQPCPGQVFVVEQDGVLDVRVAEDVTKLHYKVDRVLCVASVKNLYPALFFCKDVLWRRLNPVTCEVLFRLLDYHWAA